MFSLQLTPSPVRKDFSWVKLRNTGSAFWDTVVNASMYKAAIRKLLPAMEKNRLPFATIITMDTYEWSKAFDLKALTFTEALSVIIDCQGSIFFSGSLRKLTVHLEDPRHDNKLTQVLQANIFLQKLSASCHEYSLLHAFENIVKIWFDSSTSSRLTDRSYERHSRIYSCTACSSPRESIL